MAEWEREHPDYGPCDGFGPNGLCSQCTGLIQCDDGMVRDLGGRPILPQGLELMPGDWEASLNVRALIEKTLTANTRIQVTGKGVGPDVCDLDIKIDGAPFNIQIRPAPRTEEGR